MKLSRFVRLGKDAQPDRAEPKSLVGLKSPDIADAYRVNLFHAPLVERMNIERHGVPIDVVLKLIGRTKISTSEFQRIVNIPKATYTKRIADKSPITGVAGQAIVGLLDMISLAEAMVRAVGDTPEAKTFDAAKWIGAWIKRPQSALGGVAPAEIMDTPSGRQAVMRLLGAIQSGAYQ